MKALSWNIRVLKALCWNIRVLEALCWNIRVLGLGRKRKKKIVEGFND
jgi:hypothetical protein